MTHNYVDKSVQTTISGLAKHPPQVPPALSGLATTTPPEDMPAKGFQNRSTANAVPSLLVRRKQRASLAQSIVLPSSQFEEEGSHSPPPTEAILSPLPAANKLHAGHTPIIPRSLSPLRDRLQEHSRESSPEIDEALTGPLTLPAQPGDGSSERIELKVLDAELEKIARAQRSLASPPSPSESEQQQGRKGSNAGGRRRCSADDVEVVDGVILKKPRMNMGAPLGQA